MYVTPMNLEDVWPVFETFSVNSFIGSASFCFFSARLAFKSMNGIANGLEMRIGCRFQIAYMGTFFETACGFINGIY